MSKTGQHIKTLRLKLNLSQSRFGAKIGLSGKTISAYETGRCEPALAILQKIADIYGEVFLHAKNEYTIEVAQKIQRIKDYLADIEKLFD